MPVMGFGLGLVGLTQAEGAGVGKEGYPKCCSGFGERETEAQSVMETICRAVSRTLGSI